MPVFTYEAISQEGEKTSGTVPAASRAAALDAVAQRGLVPLAVDEQRPAAQARTSLLRSVGRVSQASVEGCGEKAMGRDPRRRGRRHVAGRRHE
ncbi:MAG: hypothetical protein AMS14_05295 [Planctomycetes bacterium DG_20]|nr:MAG: hypothetical protein AMS14_05295 [Planctomycetes bacterium DG_20]